MALITIITVEYAIYWYVALLLMLNKPQIVIFWHYHKCGIFVNVVYFIYNWYLVFSLLWYIPHSGIHVVFFKREVHATYWFVVVL